jgi:hypothetical protein
MKVSYPKNIFSKWPFSVLFQFETTLKNIYGYLQRLAVGLEQVVLDQNVYDGTFMDEFNEAEFKLKAVSQSVLYIQAGLPDGLHIFKPKTSIWVNFGGSCNGKIWYI